jgi:hypothetical protein
MLILTKKKIAVNIYVQVFPSHDALSERVRKTFYYGKLPASDREE